MPDVGDNGNTGSELVRMRRKLVRLARRHLWDPRDAEDIAQIGLMRFLRYMSNMGGEIEKPLALARRIVHNLCIDENRRLARGLVPVSLDSLKKRNGTPVEFMSHVPLPDELLAREDIFEHLRSEVQKLRDRDRAIIEGLFYEGKTQQEVADTLNISVKSVYNIRLKIFRLLTKKLNKVLNM